MNSMNEQPTERVANGVESGSASAQSSMRSADASLEATRAIPVRQVVSYSPDQSFSSQPTIASHPVAQAEKTARMSAQPATGGGYVRDPFEPSTPDPATFPQQSYAPGSTAPVATRYSESSRMKKKQPLAVIFIGAVVALVLFSPVMAVVAMIIKFTSPGPLIFKQERIGYQNRPFYMYKFRSMVVQEEAKEKKGWTTKNDPRVTPIGKFIRKTSIDELPQLINVLKGDMSLVGPRPERPQFVEKFQEEIPRYMVKHQVRPGLTGWAQVNGYRGDTSIRGRIDHDLYYIENWTLGFDFKILFLTFFKGFINKNAY